MAQLTRRKLLGASAINGGGFILASLVVLAWSLLMVRAYPGQASGHLLLALSAAGLINSLDLGVSMGLVRVISMECDAADPHSPLTYFRSAMWVSISSELLFGSLGVAIWRAHGFAELPLQGFVATMAFALSAQALLLCTSAMKGLLDFKASNLISTGSTLVVYGVGLAMAATRRDTWQMLSAMALAQGVTAVLASLYAVRCLAPAGAPDFRPAPSLALRAYPGLLQVSIRLFPQMFTGIFFLHAQRFLIARYVGLDAIAVTSFAYSVATRLHAVVNAFLEVIFPMARQLQRQGVEPRAFCARLGVISSGVYLACAALAAVAASSLIPAAVPILLVFVVGVTFAIASAPAFHLLNGSGAATQVSLCSILSPLIFVCITPSLHQSLHVGNTLLLPTAYALTMLVMLVQVVFMVDRFAKKLMAH